MNFHLSPKGRFLKKTNKQKSKLIKIHGCIAGVREHRCGGAGNFSVRGVSFKMTEAFRQSCYSDGLHLALEDISE